MTNQQKLFYVGTDELKKSMSATAKVHQDRADALGRIVERVQQEVNMRLHVDVMPQISDGYKLAVKEACSILEQWYNEEWVPDPESAVHHIAEHRDNERKRAVCWKFMAEHINQNIGGFQMTSEELAQVGLIDAPSYIHGQLCVGGGMLEKAESPAKGDAIVE